MRGSEQKGRGGLGVGTGTSQCKPRTWRDGGIEWDDMFLTSPSPLPYCIAYAVCHSDISKMFSLSTFRGDG